MNIHRHSLYATWSSMIQRCTNPNNPDYPRYGARGITVCKRWRVFRNFAEDIGDRPAGYQLDRKDNDGNYEPGNWKWSTPSEQARNRHTNRKFTIAGITKTLAKWIDGSGLKESTVHQRLYVYKWPIEKALGTKIIGYPRERKIA